ncbi:MAG: nitrous oxide reductase family maturation protein NosD [Sulfurimonas sp.]
MLKIVLFLFFLVSHSISGVLQDVINSAAPYSTIKLPSGIYLGNIVIDKPLKIIGLDNAIIKGDNKSTVVTINSSFVTLQNLTITNSGNRMYKIDAGIRINKAKECEISSCKILNSLYGIDMFMVQNSLISNNYITSKKLDIEFRGNALKLYYSNHNKFIKNKIINSKDVTLNYSHHNLFQENRFIKNRFSSHLSLSNDNIFKNNYYSHNSVSIILMGAKNTQILNNHILSSTGAAGIGVMVKGVANLQFRNNIVKYNAKGLYIDSQEKMQGMKRYIVANEIAYNSEAIHFHASIKDNTITHNKIFANIEDIVKDVDSGFYPSNIVEYNYWDRYTGFDNNKDNIGDTPHQVYQYSDQLWQYNNKVKFYYGSPIMSLLNFLSRLAPFIEPKLIFEDKKPIYH